jgi:DNA invertase Pin-like site-specific DNA recombinase
MAKVKACGYTRMSTGKAEQEHSPERQREEIEAYAKQQGYRIVKWYSDDAVSGDHTEKRSGFQSMIADATAASEFSAILVFDRNRFGRFDSVEGGYWSYKLRTAGIQLVTVTKGVIDWNTFAGRVVDAINTEGQHQFLASLSDQVSSGMERKARAGQWSFGSTPFGYKCGEDKRLEIDHDNAKVVVEIFEKYRDGWSLRELSAWLADSGVTSQQGNKWSAATLAGLLGNEHYLGKLTYNRTSQSTYRNGVRKGKAIKLPEDRWIVVADAHEPIVTQELFDQVQSRRKANRKCTGPKSVNGQFALKSLVKCGDCGGPMDGWYNPQAKRREYICRGYQDGSGSCQRFLAREQEVLKHVLAAMRVNVFDTVLTGDTLDRLRAEMERLTTVTKASAGVAKAQLKKVEARLEKAKRRLVEVDSDMVAHVTAMIRQLEDEQAQLTDSVKLKEVEPAGQIALAQTRIESALGWLSRLEEIADTEYDPKLVRDMLGQMVQSIKLTIERRPIGKNRFRCVLVGGEIHFRIAGLSPEISQLIFTDLSCSDFQTKQINGSLVLRFSLAA